MKESLLQKIKMVKTDLLDIKQVTCTLKSISVYRKVECVHKKNRNKDCTIQIR